MRLVMTMLNPSPEHRTCIAFTATIKVAQKRALAALRHTAVFSVTAFNKTHQHTVVYNSFLVGSTVVSITVSDSNKGITHA